MKRLFAFIVLLALSVWIGLAIHTDQGYVLIAYQNWSIEMTFWFAVVGGFVLFCALYLILRLINGILRLSGSGRRWARKRRARRARNRTMRGLCALAKGDWKDAERDLVRAVGASTTPLINYLSAARAAQAQHHYNKRDGYLRLAYQCAEDVDVAVGLTQAQLQLEAKQWERALATLTHLHQVDPQHAHVLMLLQQTYLALEDWAQLQALLPVLQRRKIMPTLELHALSQRVYVALFSAAQKDAHDALWKSIPTHLKRDTTILTAYIDCLMARGDEKQAEPLIRNALKRHWDLGMVVRYSQVAGEKSAKQLATAEAWLKTHPNDPVLLLCVARLCQKNRIWGKARRYLEQSIAIAPSKAAYGALGQLLEQLEDPEAALESYRKGMHLVESTPHV